MLRLLSFLGLIFLLIIVYFYIAQRAYIYFPDTHRPIPKQWQASDMQALMLTTQDHLTLLAWYKKAQKNQPTLLFLHGNAGHIGHRMPTVRPLLEAGLGVLLLSYRGYGGNPGQPSEQGLYLDGQAALNYLTEHEKIPTHCMVLFGESLGTGVAVELASRNKIAGVILQSPYLSMISLALIHYPLLPSPWLLKDRYASIEKIKHVQAPLLILQGEKDEVVPATHGSAIYAAASSPKFIHTYPMRAHNNLLHPQFVTDLLIFLNKQVHCRNS